MEFWKQMFLLQHIKVFFVLVQHQQILDSWMNVILKGS